MPGLVPGSHEFPPKINDVDGRDKPGPGQFRYSSNPQGWASPGLPS